MATSTDGYALLKTINLPGTVGGHGDIVAFDADTKTVWLAQSPDNNVVVIDTTTNTVKATIPNIGNANGIALTPQYAFVADVTNNTTDVIDKHTFQVVAQIHQTGTTPDGVIYIPSTNQVAVASDDANVLDFINASGPFTQTASIQLQPNPAVSGPDVPLYVPQKDLIYQPDDQQMDVINPHTGAIVNTFNLVSTGTVKPAVYDPVTNHLLVGTTNNQLLVVNPDTGAILQTIAIPGSVDQGTIDVSARLAFFGDKAGTADIVNLDTNQLVGGLPAEKNMHTLDVDPTTHDVYVYENNRNTVDVYGPQSQLHTEYRFFNPTTGDHLITADVNEVNQLIKNQPSYHYEGVVGASPDKSADTQDVFRFVDTATNSHFYTTSTTERDQILKTQPSYHFEGVAFEAYTNPSSVGSSGATFERFFNTNTHEHTYTADPNEISAINSGKEGAGWVDEGKAFTIHVATDGLLHV
ncbi:hypothetical protein [Methylobacterium nigriterrae]|uniref:hypothetical protein n=1 Tax=Methylobacterium nigriterrae TaxID=3127512 RepID=UPI0030137495